VAHEQPMREYVQDYRDRREPKRVWRRIVIKFLGASKSWRVRKSRRKRWRLARFGGGETPSPKQGTSPLFITFDSLGILADAACAAIR